MSGLLEEDLSLAKGKLVVRAGRKKCNIGAQYAVWQREAD